MQLILVPVYPYMCGNTLWAHQSPANHSVYPHLRGEHDSHFPPQYPGSGSSPPAWGTYCRICGHTAHGRFIPTCVGNISCPDPRICPAPVHPHTRGEHAKELTKGWYCYGSSPHSWVTSVLDGFWRPCTRFIPTPVGNICRLHSGVDT